MPRCPNGTRRNKKTGTCKAQKRCKRGTRRDKKTSRCVRHQSASIGSAKPGRLSTENVEKVIQQTGISSHPEVGIVRQQLKKLTLESDFTSCFGEKLTTLFSQAIAKVQCWRKYGDPIA
jgi:hypothetical protein